MRGDAIGHIVAWSDKWMPDLPRERAKAIACDIVHDPVRFKAATLAWRLHLTQEERDTLGIKTIRPFGVSDADMKERRKAKWPQSLIAVAPAQRLSRAGQTSPAVWSVRTGIAWPMANPLSLPS